MRVFWQTDINLYFYTMNLSLILFTIGILGFVLNRKNIILMLISIEIMLLAITFLILVSSLSFDDILGQTYAIYIIAIAGAESAIGLGILVAFYRLNSSLILSCLSHGHTTYSKNVNKFSSKRIARCYSTMAKNNDTTNQPRNYSIDPWFITGLFDAESSFVVTILKNSRYKTGWNVQARVQIKMHEKDRVLIQSIQEFFGGIGYVVAFYRWNSSLIVPCLSRGLTTNTKHVNKFSSKRIARCYSTMAKNNDTTNKSISCRMDPWFITGFVDAEGCFTLGISRNKLCKTGWSIQLFFQIALHIKDAELLERIQTYFGVGKIHKHGPQSIIFRISSIKDLQVLFNHFDKYPLVTQKLADYNLFKLAYNAMINKEHLTQEGLLKLVAIKGSLNLGLSPELQSAFPRVINADKPLVEGSAQKLPNPNWLAGFA